MQIEDKFNELCKLVNWNKTINYKQIKPQLIKKYTFEEIELLEEFGRSLREKLEEAVTKYEIQNNTTLELGSDDGYSDLLSDIIGGGTNSVEKHIENVELILNKYENNDFTENFFYCFPYKEDYEKTNLEYYIKECEKIKERVSHTQSSEEILILRLGLFELIEEFSKGEFNPSYSYDTLNKLGQKFKLGASLANLWSDGVNFYSV